jgi:hypothetical protein
MLVFMSEMQPHLVWEGLNSKASQNFLPIVGLFRVSTPSIYVGCKFDTAGRTAVSKPNKLLIKFNPDGTRCCKFSVSIRRMFGPSTGFVIGKKEKDVVSEEKLDEQLGELSASHIRNT